MEYMKNPCLRRGFSHVTDCIWLFNRLLHLKGDAIVQSRVKAADLDIGALGI